MQQRDIFADSRDVVVRNDVIEQLQRRDAVAARTALELLAGEYPDEGALHAMTVLVRELEGGSTAPFADHAALAIGPRPWRFGAPRLTVMSKLTPHRCGFWRVTGRPRLGLSKALNRGGASRHRLRG
jgi:hypothetical protein